LSIHEEEKLEKHYDAALMRRLLHYVKPYRKHMGIAILLLLIASVLETAGPYLIKIGIDEHIARSDSAGLWKIGGLYLLVLVLGFAFNYARRFVMDWIGQHVVFDLRLQVFSHLQKLPLSFFDRNQVGRLMTRVTSDVEALNEMFSAGLVAIFGDVFTLTAILAIMFKLNWKLTLVTLSVVPLLFIATLIFKRKVRHAERDIRLLLARINSFLQENITGMSVVQLFNRERKNFAQFDERNERHLHAYRRIIFYHAVFYPVVELIGALAVALIIWLGGGKILAGAMTFGSLVAFILYIERFFQPISDLAEKYGILQTAMASSERIFKLLDEPPESSDGRLPALASPVRGEIEFRNVSFGYRDDQPVLKNVSFKIAPGEKVAIVGATGAGKTTIISLLTRFYGDFQGQILIDGRDMRELPLESVRRNIGLVIQDVFLFAGTIAENIHLGNERISHEHLRQAAADVGALRFIERLPQGFQEEVIERGNTLSVGQKQLLSFARALAYNPAILILDEATSSVDTETELAIQRALERLMENRTSIIIAHRLSTIQHCDRIMVMHKGEIREMGTHQDLLAQRGIYYRLYELQFAGQEKLSGRVEKREGEWVSG
jgi:ATP-binding cassette subfamily B protein